MSASDRSESDCPTICPTATTVTGTGSRLLSSVDARPLLIATGCQKWSCPSCGPTRKRRLVRRIINARPTKMITLTCDRSRHAMAQWAWMKHGINKLTQWLRLNVDDELEYIRILEWTKDHYPHAHLLARTDYIDRNLLKAAWTKFTPGWHVVDIQKAHGQSAAYVTKYVTKGLQNQTPGIQTLAVTKKFWIEDNYLPEYLLQPKRTRQHPAIYCQQTDTYVQRERPNKYLITEREPGDELPPELQLRSSNELEY